nr:PLxRFG domain-containing protein [Brucella anthropi]DAM62828.1 MAG TPA: Type I restriction enzyme [Caudoviricetes sp.]
MAIILDKNADLDKFFGIEKAGENSPAAQNRAEPDKPKQVASINSGRETRPSFEPIGLDIDKPISPQPAQAPVSAQEPVAATQAAPTVETPQEPQPAAVPGVNSRDWNDAVNTIIAEAAGEGPVGMLAVANVMRNRAAIRGQSLGDVVRAPAQFTGFWTPGAKAVEAQSNPAVRAEAEQILRGVLTGELQDPTGGADHYHADSVNPEWAQEMPQTARIGVHTFYNSKGEAKPVQVASLDPSIGQPKERPRHMGLGNLVPEPEEPKNTPTGSLSFVHKGQENINPQFAAILTDVSGEIGRGLVINSGYRSPKHAVERAKASGGGEHTHGTAVDISMKGMNGQQRFDLVQSLKARGVKRFITYTNSPDMLHVDLKQMPQSKDGFWYMHDKSASNMDRAPDWLKAARATRVQYKPVAQGKPIEAGPDFRFEGDPEPVAQEPAGTTPQIGNEQPQTPAESPEADQVETRLGELNKESPGRYQAMTEDEYAKWRENWEANQPGVLQDIARMFAGGAVTGTASVIQGIGRLDAAFNANVLNPIFGTDYSESNEYAVPAEWIKKYGEGIKKGVSQATKEAVEASSPDGDILRPSTWTLGENPSTRGLVALGADVFGAMMPVIAASVATGGTGGFIAGGTQGAGNAEDSAYQIIDEMAAQPGLLEKQSAYFREQLASGKTREQAIRATKDAAANVASVYAAPVAGAGGVLTGKIFHPATKMFAGAALPGRVAGRAAVGAAEEGSQEALETVAGKTGVNQAVGTDVNVTDGTFGDFVLGALAGGATGAAGGAMSRRAPADADTQPGDADAAPAAGAGQAGAAPAGEASAMSEPVAEAPQRKGPLTRAFEESTKHTDLEYVVNDPDMDGSGPGELHGQTVIMSANQDRVPTGMHRVIDGQGVERVMGDRLLVSTTQAQESGLRPADQTTASSVSFGANAPTVGSTVDVALPDGSTIRGRIDSYSDGEAVIADDVGEVYQVPVSSIRTPDATPTETKPVADAQASADAALPERDAEAQDEIPAQPPIAGETRTLEPVVPAEQQTNIVSAENSPKVGQSVIVNAPGLKRVTGKVEQYVYEDGKSEAIVREAGGMTIQVPVEHLYVDSKTNKEAEAEELRLNPPVERPDIDPNEPRVRKFGDKSVRLPDDQSTRIFELGEQRAMAKRLLGASELDKDRAAPPAQRALADELGISFEDAGKLADDYRYRVEKAGRQARSKLPVEMHNVNPVMLDRMRKRVKSQDEEVTDAATVDAPAEPAITTDTAPVEQPSTTDTAAWYNALPEDERATVLASAGIKRSPKAPFDRLSPKIQQTLNQQRQRGAAPAAPIDVAATEAATHPDNDRPEPTEAQKEAGNYAKGHVRLGGMELAIENPAGSERKGVDASGKAWSTTMQSHYGYIKGTIGRDKDHIDVFVKPGTAEISDDAKVYVVDQKNPDNGRFDEHKVMIGFDGQPEAEAAYLANYTPGWKGMGDVTESTLADFRKWTRDGDTKKAFAPKWFGDRNRAEGYIRKQGLENSHVIVENGKRFEIRPASTRAANLQRMSEDFQRQVAEASYGDVWGSDNEPIYDALSRLTQTSPLKDREIVKAVRENASDADLLNAAARTFGIGGAGGNKYMVETREGPTVTVTLDKDQGKEKVVLKGKKLADILRREFTETVEEMRAAHEAKEAARTPVEKQTGPRNAEKLDQLIDSGEVATAADAADGQWGANNKLVSRDRADEIRKKLRAKLNGQINSGIDPEILALGTELAAFHIEAGARRFADFARAVAADMDTSIEKLRPFLRAWYNGARDMMEDSGLDIAGTDDANEVRAALATLKESTDGSLSELETPSGTALETVPAEPVQGTESSRNAGNSADGSGRADRAGNEPTDAERVPAGRSVPDGQGAVPVPARGRERVQRTGTGPDLFDASDDRRSPEGQANDGTVSDSALSDSVNPEKRVTPDDSAATPAHNRPDGFTITDEDAIGEGGPKTKFRNNVEAIKLLRKLADENRQATHAEQKVLAKWVGWGGLQQAFVRPDGSTASGWDKEAASLKELLSPEEYRAAEASTRNAHYTSPEIVKAIWKVAQRLGFRGGRVLEPSLGSGNFLGLAPGALKHRAQFTGAELDPVTGGIAQQLYPAANIKAATGFQDLQIPDNYFELAIGNPPFGSERLYDAQRKDAAKFSIHNYFFAKSVDTLKPGGVLSMVITNSFLDAASPAARRYIAERARLVGAIRLPNNAFLANAGTEVTTDIIVLQKYAEGTPQAEKDFSWVDIGQYRDKEGRDTPLNRYFIDHPEMMLGEFGRYGTMYGPEQPALVSRDGDNLPALLDKAIDSLPAEIMPTQTVEEVTESAVNRELDPIAIPVGSYLVNADGNIEVRVPDLLGDTRVIERNDITGKDRGRITGLVALRDAFTKLRRAQIDPATVDSDLDAQRAQLNATYDAFVKEFGPINADINRRAFQDDPTWPQVSALETDYDKGLTREAAKKTGETPRKQSAKKAPIFSRRTQEPYSRPQSAETAKDALAIAMSESGYVDMARVLDLYRKPVADVIAELGDRIYMSPDGDFQTADIYLSGNVKQKLARAEEAAKLDPSFNRNVLALRDKIPADIEPVDIDVKAGAPWIPASVISDFVKDTLETRVAKAVYSVGTARWEIETPNGSPVADARWGTPDASARTVVVAALNAKTITISHRTSDGKTIIDESATDAANQKVEAVKSEWKRWIWDNDARREQLARLYNDTFNTHVDTVYDGSHLTLPGKVSDDVVELRPHQKSFVWRVLQSATTLADHTVGAGKTFAAIASVMELRRTGQAKKPAVVVPNHLVQQWAADFIKLYPGANILAATKRDFEAGNRKRFFARVAAGDYDAVIIAHSSFGLIGVDPVFERDFLQMQVNDIEESISTLEQAEGKSSRSVKQMAKQRETLQTRMKKLLDAGGKDTGMTFEEMGIDALVVDEAHEFKNLGFATSMTRVAGLGNKAGSKKAADLFMKLQSVMKRTGGRNVVFLTGTPISNTMAELYTMQRYLSYDALKAQGVAHFDAWARVFGEVVTDFELSASGKYKLTTRFSRFVNMPELVTQYRVFADTITNDDIRRQLAEQGKTLPLPRVKGDKPTANVVEPSEYQTDFIGNPTVDENGIEHYPHGSIVWRSENLPKKAEKGADNMLKVTSDARKAALDMRLISPDYPDFPGSKVNRAADNIKRIYDGWHSQKGTQLVFIDLSTPKKAVAKARAEFQELQAKADAGDETAQARLDNISPDEIAALESSFSVYDDLKDKLIARGIPASEIAFIHDANTDIQKQELFGKVRSGQTRILFGSTPKMGAGTNVQNRLVALHHLDAPWRPSDLEQREGRIIRQGNELYSADPDGFEVEIHRYATKRTLDAKQWQTIEQKARFIGQFRAGNVKERAVEDIGGEAANSAEMKAAASGNPLILDEMDLRRKVKRLENEEREHSRAQHSTARDISRLERERDDITGEAEDVKADADAAKKFMSGDFSATVNGKTFDKAGDVGSEILDVARDMVQSGAKSRTLGKMGPFKLQLEHASGTNFVVKIDGAKTYDVTLQDVGELTPVGTSMRILNPIRNLPDRPALNAERLANIENTLPRMKAQISEWQGRSELEETRTKHNNVLAALRPKKKDAPTIEVEKASDEAPKASVSDAKPVARLTGDEVMKNFQGGEDMPALRDKAQEWYQDNLVVPNKPAMMKDGTVVHFNRVGLKESTYGRKGDILLRSVPAIKAIIEKGNVVLREPGTSQGVIERVVITAPIQLAGQIKHLAVSVHLKKDGNWHYAFNIDRDAGNPGVSVPGGPAAKLSRNSELEAVPGVIAGDPSYLGLGEQGAEPKPSALEGITSGINLFYWPSEINATGESAALRSALANGPFGETVSRLIDNGAVQLQELADEGVQAWTMPDGTIVLNTNGLSAENANGVLLHEAFHAGGKRLIGTRAWNTLISELSDIQRRFERSSGRARAFFDRARERVANAERTGEAMDPTLAAEEFGAYAIEEFENAPRSLRMWADKAVGVVKAWALRRFGKQLGEITPAQLRALASAALRDAQFGTGQLTGGEGPKRFSLATAPRTDDIRNAVDTLNGKITDMTPKALALIPFNYFTELAQKGHTAIADYLTVKRQLDSYRGRRNEQADKIVQQWRKFNRLGKDRAQALADIMHESTIAGYDPSIENEAADIAKNRQLQDRYNKLPDAGKTLFQTVRDSYVEQSKELDSIIVDNLKKVFQIAQNKAERQYRKKLEQLSRQKMAPADRRQAEQDAQAAYEATTMKAKWSMRARLTKLRQALESSRVDGPYFPLARFGDYFVTVKDIDGQVLHFSLHEGSAERDREAAALRKQYPNADIVVGIKTSSADLKQAMDPRVIADIQAIIGQSNIDSDVGAQILDQIWQRYLQTMPDMSIRKRQIHRKKTAGYVSDALRAYASHMFHSAHQMGRLKYGVELNELVNTAAEQAQEMANPTKAGMLANELRKRHQWVMNPTGSRFAQAINSTAFVWYLAATPAAALVNLSQTPMMGIPIIGSRFGMAKTTAALLRASGELFRGNGSVQHESLSADEKAALANFYDSGLIDRTQSHDLAGVGDTGVNYSPWRASVMAKISYLFHKAEVINREVTALAAYRLARDSGMRADKAIEAAHDLTWKTHFDYSNSSRPRIMQNDFAKVALVFRSYSVNMIYRVTRDLHQAMKGESPQARKEALYQLSGVFGMMGLMSGVTGIFGFNAAMAILGMLFGDDDDPFDFEQKVSASIIDALGPTLGGMVLKGPIGHLAGVDLTNRIGMGDIWFRSPSRDLDGQQEFQYWVMNSLGASVSMAGDFWKGTQSVLAGDYQRGSEYLVPKVIRDAMKAYRYGTEGVKNARGDEVVPIDDISWGDIGRQAVGFTPAKVSESWDRNNALKNAESRVNAKRRTLMNEFATAVEMKDKDARQAVMQKIRRFNSAPEHKAVQISQDALRRSIKTRRRNAKLREDGALITNQELGKQLRSRLPERLY